MNVHRLRLAHVVVYLLQISIFAFVPFLSDSFFSVRNIKDFYGEFFIYLILPLVWHSFCLILIISRTRAPSQSVVLNEFLISTLHDLLYISFLLFVVFLLGSLRIKIFLIFFTNESQQRFVIHLYQAKEYPPTEQRMRAPISPIKKCL